VNVLELYDQPNRNFSTSKDRTMSTGFVYLAFLFIQLKETYIQLEC